MKIGVNWIAPQSLPIIRKLIEDGVADFCEIMLDNAIHLPAEKIQAALPNIPVSLHIVASRFLEKTPAEMRQMARELRPWIAALQPMYVSDHLVRFTEENRRLPFVAEYDYQKHYEHIRDRVAAWQELLDTKILFENHASISAAGAGQAIFFEKLLTDTNADLLFDFSNAYIAEHNEILSTSVWNVLINNTKHFHVAGFRVDKESGLAIDTHDAPIADEVLTMMSKYLRNDKTIVVEFDANASYAAWKNEIKKLRKIVC